MAVVSWPDGVPHCPIPFGVQGGHQDNRASFVPDVGAPIERPRTTAVPEVYEVKMPVMTQSVYALFKGWFEGSLAYGARSFVWRHPVSGEAVSARLLKNDPPFKITRRKDWIDVALTVMILPGTPWWAPYVRDGAAQLPAFVADYENSVYGIADGKVPASDLPSIAGTFDLYTTNTSDVETLQASHVVTAGDITEAQPGGVNRYVGFSL